MICTVCGEQGAGWRTSSLLGEPIAVCQGCLQPGLPIPFTPSPLLDELARQVHALAELGIADNTRRAYTATWRGWREWCARRAHRALPADPATVALYLADRSAECKVSTLRRHLAAIATLHRAVGKPDPTKAPQIAAVLRGIARSQGTATDAARPLQLAELRSMLDALPDNAAGTRDRAVLLLGIGGALRRSELAALDVEDLEIAERGIDVRIRRSKTDQAGAGEIVPVRAGSRLETCPRTAVVRWLEVLGRDHGPLFVGVTRWGTLGRRISGRAIGDLVQRAARAVGLDEDRISGHTLRATFATLAAEHGASEREIARVGRWRSRSTVDRYVRHATRWTDHPFDDVL